MMPTAVPDDVALDAPVEADEPIPEVEAELGVADDFEAFLHAVRHLVHGGAAEPLDALDAVAPRADEVDDALPGLGVDARVPAQAGPDRESSAAVGTAADASRRARRRERRRNAARSIALAVPAVEPEPAADPGSVAGPLGTTGAGPVVAAPRRIRRRERSLERARVQVQTGRVLVDVHGVEPEPVEDVLVPSAPAPVVARTSRWARRRHRREEQAFARAIARAVARGESGPGRDVPETLEQYLARVESARLPRRSRRSRRPAPLWARRTAKTVLVGALIAGCVALPWAAPQVPGLFADLLPDNGTTAQVEDPPVAPPADAFVGPIGIEQQAGPYAGVRLLAAGQPREVRVSRLHVDSDVVPISGQSGSLLPPSDPQVLGWWQEGKPVGAQYGTAVITGHTVHTGGGALDNLDKLVVGDTVRVRTDQGWIGYVVQRTRIYPTAELARDAEKIFRLGGAGRLVLITCDDWNGSFYESNAVVFAAPVADEPFATSGVEVPDAGPAAGADDPSGNMDGPRGVAPVKPIDR